MTTAETESIGAHVAVGMRWGALHHLIQQGTRFGAQIFLTRLLAPSAFGLLALAFVVINLGALLSGLGLSQALVQRRDLDRKLVDAVFVGSGLLGLLLFAAVALLAGPLSTLLGDPAVEPVLRVLSVIFLFQGVEGAPNTMLLRKLLYRPFMLSSTIAVIAGAAAGVAVGLAGGDVWALVTFAVTEAVIASALAWVFALRAGVWRPGFTWDLRPLRMVAGYSGAVTGNRVLIYGSRNVDNLIVGRVLGATALGYYNLAYRVMLLPIQRAAEVIASVSLPAFAKLQHDAERLRGAYLRAVHAVSVVVVPATVGLALTAHHAVPVIFGAQWEPAVTPLRILCLSGPALALVRLNSTLWEAIGRATLALTMSVIALAVLVPAFLVGVQYGIVGVSVAFTATVYVGLAPALVAIRRSTGIRVREQVGSVLPIAVAAAVMVGVGLLVDRAVPDSAGDVLNLLAMAGAGAVTFGAVLWAIDREKVKAAFAALRRAPA